RAITGLEFTKEDIREAAERTWNLLKLLNAKEDFSRKDDKFPSEWFKSLKYGDNLLEFKYFSGDVLITKKIAEKLLDDYYNERGWKISNGLPKNKKITQLNLSQFNS
ncbi:MAG: hypothetical protein GF317_08945, partial [Candidatus Lokiarchaeota archaeon]|nr:hypothetical protein [Candidatus Lokiarchaeota archaeon]MBD3199838.1 hypothetical protein [Candidatus Lokiarchaeota archaeon]